MWSISGFKQLKLEVANYESTCFEDLRIFAFQVIRQIRDLTFERDEVKNDFYKAYMNIVILPSLQNIEVFVRDSEKHEEKMEFKTRSIKYHFNFIIDSCIYASMMNYKEQ
jgi:hypothetical protein